MFNQFCDTKLPQCEQAAELHSRGSGESSAEKQKTRTVETTVLHF